MVLVLALGAGAAYGVAIVLQFRGAQGANASQRLHLGLLKTLARNPVWLGGLALNGAGFALRFLALRHGSLSVVQPVVLSGVALALPAESMFAQRPLARGDVAAAAVTTGALLAFVLTAGGDVGHATPTRTAWMAVGAVAIVAVAALVILARRRAGPASAMATAAAGGLLAALAAAMSRVMAAELSGHSTLMPVIWQAGVLAGLGVASIVLVQSAYNEGPLTAALPAVLVVEPVASVVVGVAAFHERLPHGAGAVVVMAAALAAMVVAASRLAKTEARQVSSPAGALDR